MNTAENYDLQALIGKAQAAGLLPGQCLEVHCCGLTPFQRLVSVRAFVRAWGYMFGTETIEIPGEPFPELVYATPPDTRAYLGIVHRGGALLIEVAITPALPALSDPPRVQGDTWDGGHT